MNSISKRGLSAPRGLDFFNFDIYEENITEEMNKQFSSKIRKNSEEVPCHRCRIKGVGVEKWATKEAKPIRHLIKNIFIVIFLVFWVFSGLLPSQDAKIKPVLLKDNLYLLSGLGGNIVFMITEEGVLVIDSGSTTEHGKQITEAIAKITAKPIKYLIFTHYHYDHTGGARGFAPDVQIVGHSKLEKNLIEKSKRLIEKLALPQFEIYMKVLTAKVKKLEADKSPQLDAVRRQLEFVRSLYQELKYLKPVRPDIHFGKKKIIHLGKETVELIYQGPGHTDDACMVYFPEKKILHTGNLFLNRVCPFIDELANDV